MYDDRSDFDPPLDTLLATLLTVFFLHTKTTNTSTPWKT